MGTTERDRKGRPTQMFLIRAARCVVHPCAARGRRVARPGARVPHPPHPLKDLVASPNPLLRLLGDPAATGAAAPQPSGSALNISPFFEDLAPAAPPRPAADPGVVALRLSAAELQALVAATSDVVIVLDREGRYLRVGSSARNKLIGP